MRLILFFSYGISLKTWVDTGLFQREKLLYEQYIRDGVFNRIYWLTYGSDDEAIARELHASGELSQFIEVIPQPRIFNNKIGKLFYSFLLPLIQWKIIRQATLLKTNQLEGSWAAVFSKKLYRKPLLVRSGYVWSVFAKQKEKKAKIDSISEWAERLAYRNADGTVVSSRYGEQYVSQQYKRNGQDITIIPNYIDTTKFSATTQWEQRDNRFIFVGRLTEQKNLFNLIAAVKAADVELDIYGDGELRDNLVAFAGEIQAPAFFKGVVNNDQLPTILNQYRYFIVTSYYEGMPKALLEAMACGLVCLGTNVMGINEVIENNKNGYLINGVDSENIAVAIRNAVKNSDKTLGQNAEKMINQEFSLNSYVKSETNVIKSVLI